MEFDESSAGMPVCQVDERLIYCGLSDGRITVFDLSECDDSSLCQSFDSSCIHATEPGRLRRPVLSLAVSHGRVYYGDGGINVKVIDCSQGQAYLL